MNRFIFSHAVIPFVLLITATILLDVYRLDLLVADYIYQLEGGQWSLKRHWFFKNLLHDGGYRLFIVLAIMTGVAFLVSCFVPRFYPCRGKLLFLLLTSGISVLLVVWLKSVSHIGCPWDYRRYGGDQPGHPIYQALFGAGTGHCFPAGHASSGYAWISLYFLALRYAPRWRYYGLALALMMGAGYGLTQQFRGAHLLSHDIWTLAICWFTSLTGFALLSALDRQRSNSYDTLAKVKTSG